MEVKEEKGEDYTYDESPAVRGRTGTWIAGNLILVNQGLATLAFYGVSVNSVLFLTRVMGQGNAEAANNISQWTGTVYMCSLVGAFLSESYWGRYTTCVVFQAILALGLGLLSLTSYMFLLNPRGCGDEHFTCGSHSPHHKALFYISIYLIALGYGGYQPNIATFGSDQFDEGEPKERHSKKAFFSYFYLALNIGSLFSDAVLVYFENEAMWTLGFWASTGSATLALILFLCGTTRYRYLKPGGNPLPRFCRVLVAATSKWKVNVVSREDNLFEVEQCSNEGRKIQHTEGFRFLDKAAFKAPEELIEMDKNTLNPWHLCTVTQVEEVKCVLRLIPIWLCTILYSVVFTQMSSLFVEQGAIMDTRIIISSSSSSFKIPPASMSIFNVLSTSAFIFFYQQVLNPFIAQKMKKKGLTELQRMGIGLFIAMMSMVSAGLVEHFRLKNAKNDRVSSSSLSILWQIPQYVLIGASEVFMYVGQLEFFNGEIPDGLKSFGSALYMMSMSLGNYMSTSIVVIVMKISSSSSSQRDVNRLGWIPGNLNKGHLDRFYFLLAALLAVDLAIYVCCAKWYEPIKFAEWNEDEDDNSKTISPELKV